MPAADHTDAPRAWLPPSLLTRSQIKHFALYATDDSNHVFALEIFIILTLFCDGLLDEKVAFLLKLFDFDQKGYLTEVRWPPWLPVAVALPGGTVVPGGSGGVRGMIVPDAGGVHAWVCCGRTDGHAATAPIPHVRRAQGGHHQVQAQL